MMNLLSNQTKSNHNPHSKAVKNENIGEKLLRSQSEGLMEVYAKIFQINILVPEKNKEMTALKGK